ncbi:hypothetical protein D3C85_1906220 [compost metagenome]
MVRRRSDLLVMRVRRISISSSGDTTISVYSSRSRSLRRNSARPSEKITSYLRGSASVGW